MPSVPLENAFLVVLVKKKNGLHNKVDSEGRSVTHIIHAVLHSHLSGSTLCKLSHRSKALINHEGKMHLHSTKGAQCLQAQDGVAQ